MVGVQGVGAGGGEGFAAPGDRVWGQQVVVVEEGDELAHRTGDAVVRGGGDPAVGRPAVNADPRLAGGMPREEFRDVFSRRGIVDGDELPVRCRLVEHRLDRRVENLGRRVEHRHHDRDQRPSGDDRASGRRKRLRRGQRHAHHRLVGRLGRARAVLVEPPRRANRPHEAGGSFTAEDLETAGERAADGRRRGEAAGDEPAGGDEPMDKRSTVGAGQPHGRAERGGHPPRRAPGEFGDGGFEGCDPLSLRRGGAVAVRGGCHAGGFELASVCPGGIELPGELVAALRERRHLLLGGHHQPLGIVELTLGLPGHGLGIVCACGGRGHVGLQGTCPPFESADALPLSKSVVEGHAVQRHSVQAWRQSGRRGVWSAAECAELLQQGHTGWVTAGE